MAGQRNPPNVPTHKGIIKGYINHWFPLILKPPWMKNIPPSPMLPTALCQASLWKPRWAVHRERVEPPEQGRFRGPMDQTGVITWHQPKQCTIIGDIPPHICIVWSPAKSSSIFTQMPWSSFKIGETRKREREREREKFSLPSFCRGPEIHHN